MAHPRRLSPIELRLGLNVEFIRVPHGIEKASVVLYLERYGVCRCVCIGEIHTCGTQVDTQCRASCARARGGCVRCGSAHNRSSLRRVFSSPPFPRCRLPTRSLCTARRYRRVLWSFCSCAILLAAARHRRRRPADEVPSARPLQRAPGRSLATRHTLRASASSRWWKAANRRAFVCLRFCDFDPLEFLGIPSVCSISLYRVPTFVVFNLWASVSARRDDVAASAELMLAPRWGKWSSRQRGADGTAA